MTPSLQTRRPDPPPDAAAAMRQIVHQLRQPLSAIETIAYYLSITLPRREAKALEQLDQMQRLVQEANLILCDAVHFFQAARTQLAPVDLNELAARAISEMPPGEGQPAARFARGRDPILVDLDVVQVTHLVRNLVGYLRQVSSGAGPVECTTSTSGSEAELSIRTASAACCAGEVAALLDPDQPRLGSGSGLAMASARRIADAHGSRISVQSQPPCGLRLTVTFPLSANK